MNKNRIEWESVMKYNKLFPDDKCTVAEPGTLIIIENAAGKKVACDFFAESDETFLERLERCELDHHNYFFDEWREYKSDFKTGCIY